MSLSVKAFFFSAWPPADIRRSSEIRRFSIDDGATSSLTYLQHKLASVFQLKRADNLSVRWRDDDGDYVDIKTDEDLMEALSAFSTAGDALKVYVSVTSSGQQEREQAQQQEHLHPNIVCDGCEGAVKGSRFKCLCCADFDLCSTCESRGLHPEHPLVRLREPGINHSPPFSFFGQGGFGSHPGRWRSPASGPGHCDRPRGGRHCHRRSRPGDSDCRAGGAGSHCGPSAGQGPFGRCGPSAGQGPFGRCGAATSSAEQCGSPFGMFPEQLASLASDFLQNLVPPNPPQQQQGEKGGKDDGKAAASSAKAGQEGGDGEESGGTAVDSDERRYQECMDRLLEFGFSDDGGWLQSVVRDCNGEVSAVLDRVESLYKQHQA